MDARFPSGRACVRKAKAHTPDAPDGYKSSPSATLELVQMSPDQFLRLENWGRRKRASITLARISLEKR